MPDQYTLADVERLRMQTFDVKVDMEMAVILSEMAKDPMTDRAIREYAKKFIGLP